MKKLLPFVFPLLAVLVIIFLVFRWYRLNTQPQGNISEFGEGIEIEDLTDAKLTESLTGAGDYQTVNLDSRDPNSLGRVRYEVKDGRVRFSVDANLPVLEVGMYQVWLREPGSTVARRAFVLEESKGGYIGSAAISEEVLPFELVVSKELRPDDQLEEVILTGVIK